MKILAIDTAGADCGVALYDAASTTLLASEQETIVKGHAERLMAMIEAVLGHAGVSMADIDRVAVSVGPGSFTGIRVGVSTARGLGLALEVPVLGISSLQALAHAAAGNGRPVLALIDAKRGEVFAQVFDEAKKALSEPAAMTIEDARALQDQYPQAILAGSGVRLLSGAEPAISIYPVAAIAQLAADANNATPKPAPLYLRGPDAKPQTGFAVARQ